MFEEQRSSCCCCGLGARAAAHSGLRIFEVVHHKFYYNHTSSGGFKQAEGTHEILSSMTIVVNSLHRDELSLKTYRSETVVTPGVENVNDNLHVEKNAASALNVF